MKTLNFSNGILGLTEKPKPSSEDEAIVRVTLSGICNTDLEIVRGYAGFEGTIGHEFVGVVESSPDVSQIGKRVVGEINAGCGKCSLCDAGDPRHCATRTVLGIVGRDGAHAEYLRLPPVNLLVVPDQVTDRQAVFVEPLAAALGITERVAISPGKNIAVIGDGKLGLMCAQALHNRTTDVTLIGKHRPKLEIAGRRGIGTYLVKDMEGIANMFDVVVEASGSESGFSLAMQILRPLGTLVLKSTFQGKTAIDAARIVVDEITVVGSRCGRFAPALELLKNDVIDVESLISDEFPLADGLRAIERAAEPGIIKVLLRP